MNEIVAESEVNKTIKIYVDDYDTFYLLWNNLKEAYSETTSGKMNAENAIIEIGENKFWGMLKDYEIEPIIKLFEDLQWSFNISKVKKYPELNISTVFGKRSLEKVFVHTTQQLHGRLEENARKLGLNIGNRALIDIRYAFSDAYGSGNFAEHISDYCIGYRQRIEQVIKAYRVQLMEHLIITIQDIEKDINAYKALIDKGLGNQNVLKEKEKILEYIQSTWMGNDKDKESDKERKERKAYGYRSVKGDVLDVPHANDNVNR